MHWPYQSHRRKPLLFKNRFDKFSQLTSQRILIKIVSFLKSQERHGQVTTFTKTPPPPYFVQNDKKSMNEYLSLPGKQR